MGALTLVPQPIEAYAVEQTTPLPPLLQELIAETKEAMGERAVMLSGPVEGTFLQALVAGTRARRVLEIGMFTGFSALMMAAALPPDGRLITCEIQPMAIEFAKRFFARSPHGSKIEVREGTAIETLKTLDGPFDFVFIDADKPGYIDYYEAALPLLAPAGLIAADNVLFGGGVLDPKAENEKAMAAFNEHVARDGRVVQVLLPVRDGITLIRRKRKSASS